MRDSVVVVGEFQDGSNESYEMRRLANLTTRRVYQSKVQQDGAEER